MNPYLIAATSFSAVMICMVALTTLCLGLRALARWTQSRPKAEAEAEASPAVDEHLIVVLTAAASEALRAPVALYSIKLAPMSETEGWTRAGRMDLMLSHRVERKR